ncbi:MAG: hypothetical protein Q8K75_06380 [Chlamydiales bacterium]|nr:hypothetical protein [Chlamydiales bacterium]
MESNSPVRSEPAIPPSQSTTIKPPAADKTSTAKGHTFRSFAGIIGNTAQKAVRSFQRIFSSSSSSSTKTMPGGMPTDASDAFWMASQTKQEADKLEGKVKAFSKKKDSLPAEKVALRANELATEISGVKQRQVQLTGHLYAQDDIDFVGKAVKREDALLKELDVIKTEVALKPIINQYKGELKTLSKQPLKEVERQFQDTVKSLRTELGKYQHASAAVPKDLKQLEKLIFKVESKITSTVKKELHSLESQIEELESKATNMSPADLDAARQKLTGKVETLKQTHSVRMNDMYSKRGNERKTSLISSEEMLLRRLTQLSTASSASPIKAENKVEGGELTEAEKAMANIRKIASQISSEMLSTEKAFGESLELMANGKPSPLTQLAEHELATDDEKATMQQYNKAITGLIKESRTMQAKLDEANKAIAAGNYEKGMQKIMEAYAGSKRYVTRCGECTQMQPSVMQFIGKVKKEDSASLNNIERPIMRAKRFGIDSVIIMPVQRLPRHKLLLADLKKRGATDEYISGQLGTAETKFSENLAKINASIPK